MNLKSIWLVLVVLLLAQNVEAQFLKKLAKHAEDKVEHEANRRAERKVDEKIDEGFDKAEEKLEKKQTPSPKAQKENHKHQNGHLANKVGAENVPKVTMPIPFHELEAGTYSSDPYPVVSSHSQKLRRYDIKSGIVRYKKIISGKVLTSTTEGAGAMALYFKDWGDVEMNEEVTNQKTITKVFGKKNEELIHTHSMNRLVNGEVYAVDFDQKSIFVRRDPAMDLMRESDSDVGDAGEQMLESMGGKKVGTDRFLGYTCDLWEIPGGHQWIYKGVVLKLDMTVLGIHTVQLATSAEFDVPVSDKFFRLPNFPLQKVDDYLDNGAYENEGQGDEATLEQMSKMTFPEFKTMAKQDPEMKDMSEEELRQNYNLMKKMANAMKN